MVAGLLAHYLLFLAQPVLIVGCLLIAMCRKEHEIWQNALVLLMLTISWNKVLLKPLFGIPLNPPLVGFAFPSGHMHFICIFWGYLAYRYYKQGNQIFPAIMVFAILPGFGWSLIYNHYHVLKDIVGAVVFSGLEIFLYQKYLLFWQQSKLSICQKYPSVLGLTVGSSILLLHAPSNNVACFSFGVLVAFLLAGLLNKGKSTQKDWQWLWVAGLGSYCLYHVSQYFVMDHGFKIGLAVSLGAFWIAYGAGYMLVVFENILARFMNKVEIGQSVTCTNQ